MRGKFFLRKQCALATVSRKYSRWLEAGRKKAAARHECGGWGVELVTCCRVGRSLTLRECFCHQRVRVSVELGVVFVVARQTMVHQDALYVL